MDSSSLEIVGVESVKSECDVIESSFASDAADGVFV